jgi:type I restriction enzyme S subunit
MDRRTTAASEALGRGLEFVGMEHVDPETGRIALGQGSRTGEGKGQAFLFDDRHVLFGKLRPYLRKIALPRQAGCASTELVPLLPDANRLDRGYLFHWVRRQTVIDTLMAKNTGARMPRADMSVLLDMPIPLPPLEEQRRIARLLDRSAEIRRRADAARAKARAVIPALFIDMFGDPATNPKGWPVTPFGDMVTNHDNRRKPVKASDREQRKGKYPYYGASGIIDYVDEFIFDERALLIAEDGANLLSRSTPIAFQADGKYWVNNHAHIVTSNGKATLDYLEVFLNLRDLKDWITGSAQPKLNQANLNRIPVPFPPLPLQTAFAEQAQRLEATARAIDVAAAKAEAMAASLSAKVFTASDDGNAAYG